MLYDNCNLSVTQHYAYDKGAVGGPISNVSFLNKRDKL